MMEQPTTLFVALSLSVGSKAITTLKSGISIIVERLPVKERYNCIFISYDGSNSNSHYDVDSLQLHDLLKADAKMSDLVWLPLRSDTTLEIPAILSWQKWKTFSDALLPLSGRNYCAVCGSSRPVFTHGVLCAHACQHCWRSWYFITACNRERESAQENVVQMRRDALAEITHIAEDNGIYD